MILTALGAVLVLLALGQTLVMLWFIRGLRAAELRARADLQAAVRSFVTPAAEGEPSPLAVLVDQCAVVLAGRLMQQLQQRAAGMSSGEARQELSQNEAAVTAGSPWLGLLAAMLPKRFKNQLMRNPQMLGQLQMWPKGNNHNEPDAESVRSRLQRGV